ncbi:MAG: hypothetical protein ACK56F_04835, partial [bacterium]
LGEGVLVLGLERRLGLQQFDDLPGGSEGAGHVHEGLVADDGGQVVHLAEELGLDLLDVLLVPYVGSHSELADLDEDAHDQRAGEGVLDVDVHVLELPSEEAQVALDGCLSHLSLLLKVDVDGDS